MDTSIAFLLLAAVLFVFIVPTVLKRSAERDEESPSDRLRTVDVQRSNRCATDDSRPQLLRDESHPARIDLPIPDVETVPTAPQLSLRTSRPALEVVAGHAMSEMNTDAPLEWEVEVESLPMAAGQTAPLDLRSSHLSAVRSASGLADVLAFAPARTMVVASAGPADSETMDLPMTSSHRTAPRRIADAAERMPSALPADIRARLAQSSTGSSRRGPSHRPSGERARPHVHHGAGLDTRRRPTPGRPTMDAASRKRVRTLRAVLPFCGLAVLALTLLTLVFAGVVIFSSMPWGVPVITAALGMASLGLVRGLNKEIRALRRGSAAEASAGRPAHRTSAVERNTARSTPSAQSAQSAQSVEPRKAREHAPARSRTVVDTEPVTADIPVVRESATASSDDAVGIGSSSTTSRHEDATEASTTEVSTAEVSTTEVSTTATATADVSVQNVPHGSEDSPAGEVVSAPSPATSRTRSIFAASAQTDGPSIAESLARRRAQGEWTPSVLPTPRYVDAPVAEREKPEPVIADASSYSLTPFSKESLAEQFAEELGFRPVLADAARDESVQDDPTDPKKAVGSDGPLGHGRTAIRGNAASARTGRSCTEDKPAQLGDILARRRA